jgi:hypothetical protein
MQWWKEGWAVYRWALSSFHIAVKLRDGTILGDTFACCLAAFAILLL